MAEGTNPNVNEPNPTSEDSMEELKAMLEQLKAENTKLKGAQSNASAEASKYKKQLQERMSEQEKAANETKELIERLQAENTAMKRERTLAEHVSGYLELGFDAESAKKAAEFTVDGDFSAMKRTFRDFMTAHDRELLADNMRSTPRPGAGASEPAVTKDQFEKMSYMERKRIYDEQPDLYQELTK